MYNKQILSFTKYRWFLFSSAKKEIYRQRIPAVLQLRRPIRKTLNLHTPESKLVTVKYTITTITETIDIIAWWGLAVLQSKRRDQHQKATLSWDKRTKFISYLAPTITTYFITYNYYVTPERDRLNWKYSIKFCTAAQLSVQEYFSSYNNWVTVGSSKQLHPTFEWKKSCSLIFSSFVITSSPLQASS